MDEHLHNDPLEDFFRRSLDDFGGEPSDDVWSNLDERLTLHESGAIGEGVSPPAASSSSIVESAFTKWIAFAAVLIFLGFFTYHIYQQNTEIANLSEHIDQQTQTIEKLNDKVDNLQYTEDKSSQSLFQTEDAKDNSIPLQNNNLQQVNSMGESDMAGSTNDTEIVNPPHKNAPANTGNSFGKSNLKKKSPRKRNRIATTKDKADSFNGLQKNAPANTDNHFVTNDLKEKNMLEGNRIAAAKDKVNTADELQKELSKNIDSSLEENGLEEKANANLLESNPSNVDEEGVNHLTEILEEDTPTLPTVETETNSKTAKQTANQASTTQTVKEAKKEKRKQKRKTPKINNNKKKSSLPEGALAQKSPSKAGEKTSVEVEDAQLLPEIPSVSDNSKWSIAASFGPSYSFRRIKNKGSKDIAKEINSREKVGFSYDLGIELAYRVQKNWSVKSGIQYRQMQQIANHRFKLDCKRRDGGSGGPQPQSSDIFDCKAEKVRGSYGEVDLDFELKAMEPIQGNNELELDVENKLNFKWLRIPVLVQHTLGSERLKTSVTGGLAVNFLLNEKPDFKTKKLQDGRFEHRGTKHNRPDNTPSSDNISKNYLEYIVGLGMSYQTSDKLQLFVEPTYSAAFKPVFENKDIQTTPFSLSGNLGIRVSF